MVFISWGLFIYSLLSLCEVTDRKFFIFHVFLSQWIEFFLLSITDRVAHQGSRFMNRAIVWSLSLTHMYSCLKNWKTNLYSWMGTKTPGTRPWSYSESRSVPTSHSDFKFFLHFQHLRIFLSFELVLFIYFLMVYDVSMPVKSGGICLPFQPTMSPNS